MMEEEGGGMREEGGRKTRSKRRRERKRKRNRRIDSQLIFNRGSAKCVWRTSLTGGGLLTTGGGHRFHPPRLALAEWACGSSRLG